MNIRHKKVLFFSADNSLGGGSFLSLVGLAKTLRNNYGIMPYIALPCEGDGSVLLQENHIPFIVVRSYGWGWPMQCKKTIRDLAYKMGERRITSAAAKTLAKYAKENEIDLIHINSSAVYVGALVAKRIKVPYVWHFREFLREGLNQTYLWPILTKRLFGRASAILTISRALNQFCLRTINNKSVFMVGNAVDLERNKVERTLFAGSKIRFAMVGIITRNKGHFDMLEAVSRLSQTYSPDSFEVLVVGETNQAFNREIKKRRLCDYVKPVGFQTCVKVILRTVDVLLMCAVNEGFGRVTAEAMAAGCLVIGAESGGTTDMVIDGRTGILFPPHDPVILAEKMERIITSPNEAIPLAKHGQTFIYNSFSYDRNAAAVVSVYDLI